MTGIAVVGIVFCERKPSHAKDIIFLITAALVMVVMASLRAESVGVDNPMYRGYFELVSQNDASFLFSAANQYRIEMGYGLLNFLVSRVTTDYRVFAGVLAALTIGLRVVAVYRQSASVWLSLFVYVSFGFFGYSLVTLRQEMAVSIVLFAIPFLQRKKPIPFFVLIILAALFHKSTLILLPFYFFARLPINKLTLGIYGAGTAFVMIFSWPIIGFITQYVYKFYAPGQEGAYYLRPRDLNTALVPVVVGVVALLLHERLLARKPENLVLINFACYSAMLFILTMKHFVFQRIGLLFLPTAALFLIPEMVKVYQVDKEKYLQIDTEYKNADKGRQKQLLHDYNASKRERQEAGMAYNTAIGLVIFLGTLYMLFLLNVNRLTIVPYTTFLG